jgi:hypothetical protein
MTTHGSNIAPPRGTMTPDEINAFIDGRRVAAR